MATKYKMNDNKTNNQEDFEEQLIRETSAPDGQQVLLHSLRFAEVIKVNDYGKFEKGLDFMYQELKHEDGFTFSNEQENYRRFIAEARKAFLSSRWLNLQGFESRSFADARKNGIITRSVRELPTGVESLGFFMCQIIPSSIVIVMRFQFDSTVSDSLDSLLIKKYSERIEKYEHSVSHIPSERVKTEVIQDFLSELQGVAESFVSRYFTGVFLSEETTTQTKCPSLKLFSLQDIPFTPKDSLIAWIKGKVIFVDVLGYLAFPSSVYQFKSEYLLLIETVFRRNERPVHLSLLSSESVFIEPKAHEGYGTAMWALKHKHRGEFDNLMPLLAFNNLLLWHSRRLISYRNEIDDYMVDSKSDLRTQYDSMYEAKVKINNDHFEFVRLRQELEDVTSPMFESRLYEETAMFELLENPKDLPHYAKELVLNMNFISANLDKEYTLLDDRYSDLFETVNTQSNFGLNESNIKLQKTVVRWTWVIGILTIIMTALAIYQIVHAVPVNIIIGAP